MPDRRKHRGAHPQDHALFGADALPLLRAAGADLAWLLERGYPPVATLKLVGDRHALVQRQRQALARAICAPSRAAARAARRVAPDALGGHALWIDGLNVLTTIEVALSGGVVLLCSDGCARDIAGVHGTHRKVEETLPALARIGAALSGWGVARCHFLLDRPVSNSARLRAAMLDLAASRGFPWEVELVDDPDPVLARDPGIVASADGEILDACGPWLNLARELVDGIAPALCVDLT